MKALVIVSDFTVVTVVSKILNTHVADVIYKIKVHHIQKIKYLWNAECETLFFPEANCCAIPMR